MSKLYIFGDSFSDDHNSIIRKKKYELIYYKKEVENGHIGEYKDLQYYLKIKLGNKINGIVNTALCSSSNARIFENFTIQSINFKPGDYVSFQSSIYSRFRVINKNNTFCDINPDFLDNFKLPENVKNLRIEEIKSLVIEHSEKAYFDESINFIKMVRHLCLLSKTKFHIWSLDDRLNRVSTTLDKSIIDRKLTINDKYSELPDFHPSFEGYEFIANNIINNWENWENLENYNKKNIKFI